MATHDFQSVTEVPGIGADAEQLDRLRHRYSLAARYGAGKRVLEVASGAGVGLGFLATEASLLVGGDFTRTLVDVAHDHYGTRVPLFQLDAQSLPFRDDSFDTIVLLEAIYYLPNAGRFFDECRRVLMPNGTLVVSTVNREWGDFNPSPFSTRYYSARDLAALLEAHGFRAELFAAFPARLDSSSKTVVSLIRRIAVKLHLIPESMRAKLLLRRIFLGKLAPLPTELTAEDAREPDVVPLDTAQPLVDHKIIYAVATPAT
jgi:ubiquinone/menaquinone biosynthesis C-methylase UbiE